jgi:hypothetical protein
VVERILSLFIVECSVADAGATVTFVVVAANVVVLVDAVVKVVVVVVGGGGGGCGGVVGSADFGKPTPRSSSKSGKSRAMFWKQKRKKINLIHFLF